MSWLSSFAEALQISLPTTSSSDIFNALTLNTEEMTAEREQFEVEARRKAAVADSISAILPWETLDETKVILQEEAKDAILLLSTQKKTFLGTTDEDDVSNISSARASELLCEEISSRKGSTAVDSTNNDSLPPLLENFDLDAHVGLVRRMFDIDPNLVEMHANLCGTCVDEVIFWKNYFFSCALTRLEIGLSINEIWGNGVYLPTEDELRGQAKDAQRNALFSFQDKNTCPSENEEEITFDENSPSFPETPSTSGKSDVSAPSPSLPPLLGSSTKVVSSGKDIDKSTTTPPTLPNDYEIVSKHHSYDDIDLEDLDAEIARELENY